jgi:hypothetical protein
MECGRVWRMAQAKRLDRRRHGPLDLVSGGEAMHTSKRLIWTSLGTSAWLALGLVAFAIGAVIAQDTPEQYPGQHEHATPPKGWFCAAGDDIPPDHRCACKNMPKDDDDPICKVYENEDDPQCSVYCHKDHCACKSSCPDSN